jgi:hypothetical protein
MAININRLTNGNVYINGTSYFGQIEEVTLPDVKAVFTDVKVLGLNAKVELPTGIDKLTSRLKLNAPYANFMKLQANPFKSHNLQFRGSLDTFQGGERVAQTPYKVWMSGTFKNAPGGAMKQNDNVEMEAELNVTYLRVVIGADEILEVDTLNNIHKVGGEDILSDTNRNQGT